MQAAECTSASLRLLPVSVARCSAAANLFSIQPDRPFGRINKLCCWSVYRIDGRINRARLMTNLIISVVNQQMLIGLD